MVEYRRIILDLGQHYLIGFIIKTALCILNRNESSNLVNLIEKIKFESFACVFAIDGKSQDDSLNILQEYGITTIVQNKLGRGNAVKIAIEKVISLGMGIENLIIISSDGNEDPKDLSKIISLLENSDLVIASRMIDGAWNEEDEKIFRIRKLVNKFFALSAYLALKRKGSRYISDPLNGLRGFKINFAKEIELESNEYAIEYEMSIKSYIYKSRVAEFPTHEHKRESGKSMVPPFKTVFQLFNILYKSIRLKSKIGKI
jgi:hypothetical protein